MSSGLTTVLEVGEIPVDPQGLPVPPVIVRLAGLPAQVIEPLTSPACVALLQTQRSLEEEIAEARRSMVETISATLLEFDRAARGFLLTIKRSCFNGREIEVYRGKAQWVTLLQLAPSLADRIVALEKQLRDNNDALTDLYERELARERRHVLRLVEDCRFLRGVALGRPGLVEKVRSRFSSFTSSGSLKAPEKWELSLLRFVTRAATKLSANSTLTTYALGGIQSSPSTISFSFFDSPRREVSLVRANRPELEQLQALLLRHPAVRERALVAWNDSLEELEPGQYSFLRDGHWDLLPGAEKFKFIPPSRIRVRLAGNLLVTAREALREGALLYNSLLARLERKNQSALDELIDRGILILMPPWPSYEPWLERRIASFLHTLTDKTSLVLTVGILDELLKLEESFASAPCPEISVASMNDAVSRLIGSVIPLAGHEGPLTTQAHFFEEVLLEPSGGSDNDSEIFQIASTTVQEILQSADLVSRFSGLFNLRHDVLLTLAAWWREHEPDRREIPFMEVARSFAPVWRQFFHFLPTTNDDALSTFNPLQAPSLASLRETRERLFTKAQELLRQSPAKDFLPAPQFEELVEALPRRYSPLLGSCVFVQPTDAEGSSWVLNRLYEGTGRYLSRVTPILEGARQQHFLNHLVMRSTVEVENEEADLVEVKYPLRYLVRAHPPQTAKVLDLRGLYLDLPRERRISLGDLQVQADLESETFRLIDRMGRRLLPVNLSTLSDAGHPNLLQFLLAFGPGESRSIFPLAHLEGDEELQSLNRVSCNNLILRRRRWRVAVEKLRIDLSALTDLRAYATLYDWRCRLRLPVEGFYYERIRHGYQGNIKPQYVNFDSPSLCRLFISSLGKMTSPFLILEESLPSPANFPFNASGERRGFELLIDSLSIRAASKILHRETEAARVIPLSVNVQKQ